MLIPIHFPSTDGVWHTDSPQTVQLGPSPVTCLLAVQHDIMAACGRCVHVISVTARMTSEPAHDDVAVVGIVWVKELKNGSHKC